MADLSNAAVQYIPLNTTHFLYYVSTLLAHICFYDGDNMDRHTIVYFRTHRGGGNPQAIIVYFIFPKMFGLKSMLAVLFVLL